MPIAIIIAKKAKRIFLALSTVRYIIIPITTNSAIVIVDTAKIIGLFCSVIKQRIYFFLIAANIEIRFKYFS